MFTTRPKPVTRERITHAYVVRVLVTGFALVLALLAAAGFIGLRSIGSIRRSAVRLVEQQSVTNRLIDELRRQQTNLTEVFSVLARDPDSVDADSILAQLGEAERQIGRIAKAGGETPQRELWERLRNASTGFSAEARRLLAADEPETFASRELFRRHAEFLAVASRLIEAGYQNMVAAQREIDFRAESLMRESLPLLAACLALALVSTTLTVWLTTGLVRSIEWQAGELSRVSWHVVENQEAAARRFSHELHDELGQSLTAVKTNLSALDCANDPRVRDCLRLVDEAIGNVRQMSQLLRPTILDDFGLEAGLRWLGEGFTHRTGITVDFHSSVHHRLRDEKETHLFRIAQEALTNIARHAGATKVSMELAAAAGEVRLTIEDDGRGLALKDGGHEPRGLGLIGMRARARSAGGDVEVRSLPGRGVTIEVRVPEESPEHA